MDFIIAKTQLSQVDQLSKNHVATVDQSQPNAHQLKVPNVCIIPGHNGFVENFIVYDHFS